jgi:hypothetical protein
MWNWRMWIQHRPSLCRLPSNEFNFCAFRKALQRYDDFRTKLDRIDTFMQALEKVFAFQLF